VRRISRRSCHLVKQRAALFSALFWNVLFVLNIRCCMSSDNYGSGGVFYGAQPFDPRKIFVQMLTLQLLWYVCLSTTVLIACYLTSSEGYSESNTAAAVLKKSDSNLKATHNSFTFDMLFIGSNYTFSKQSGVVLVLSQWLTSVAFSPILSYVVARAKKALDFTATLQFWHFLFSLYYEFPSPGWWGTAAVTVIVGTLISEAICLRWELRPIDLPGGKSNNKYVPVMQDGNTRGGSDVGRNNPTPIGSSLTVINLNEDIHEPHMPDTPTISAAEEDSSFGRNYELRNVSGN